MPPTAARWKSRSAPTACTTTPSWGGGPLALQGGQRRPSTDYDEKIALLRSLLSWRDEVTDAADWLEQFKRASLDDTIYVLTPQGRVIDMPRGATPIDFAYRVHTDLGHRCRGAKVNGQLVTLNTPLENGQTVEIMSTKEAAVARLAQPPAGLRGHAAGAAEDQAVFQRPRRGRAAGARAQRAQGDPARRPRPGDIDDLATRLGFKNAEALFIAAGRGEVGPRAIQVALRGAEAVEPEGAEAEVAIGHSHAGDAGDTILIVGVGKLMTSSAAAASRRRRMRSRATSPAGAACRSTGSSAGFPGARPQEPGAPRQCPVGRVRPPKDAVFPVDILVQAMDRQGLLRDISEVLSREKLNVIAVNTLSRKGAARMRFTIEVQGVQQIQRAVQLVHEVKGVTDVERAAAMISLQRMDRHHFAWLSIAAAVSTIALKTLAWWITGSVGLLSDALESFVNLAGASFALWMILVTRAPPDRQHPFGHGKAEYFSSGFEGILIFGAAFAIIWAAIERLLAPQPIESPGWGLAWSAAATGINFAVARVLAQAGERFNSIALRADSRHLMTDVDLLRRHRRRRAGGLDGLAAPRPADRHRGRPQHHPRSLASDARIGGWPDGPQPRPRRHRPGGARAGASSPAAWPSRGCAPGAPAPPPSCRWWCGCRATGRCATATPCSTRSRPRWWPSCPASRSRPTWSPWPDAARRLLKSGPSPYCPPP
jgi:predicted amino acid-binding ACT domain protein